jgi:hypothetical protein
VENYECIGETAEIPGDQAGMHILVRFRNLKRN